MDSRSYFPVRITLADQTEDQRLLLIEDRAIHGRGRGLGLRPHTVQQLARDRRGDDCIATIHSADGLLELEALDILDDVAASPGPDAFLYQCIVRVDSQDDHLDLGMSVTEQPAGLRAGNAGKARVEEHDVGPGLRDELDDIVRVLALTDNFKIGLTAQHHTHPLTSHFVVVHDCDADHVVSVGRGTLALTVSPHSSPGSTSRTPPRLTIRWRMSESPK